MNEFMMKKHLKGVWRGKWLSTDLTEHRRILERLGCQKLGGKGALLRVCACSCRRIPARSTLPTGRLAGRQTHLCLS